MKEKQNQGSIVKCLIAERMHFSILVVTASQWDLRAHFCFDIWPITKLLLIYCELPAKQYNLVSEQRITHLITGNNHPVFVPSAQNHVLAGVLLGPFWDELPIPEQRCPDLFSKGISPAQD